MIDNDIFKQELAKFSDWDAQGIRYGYEIDVEYTDGRVQRNECGTRKNRADDFQRDVERLAKDSRVGRILVRLFRGTTSRAFRMDRTKEINSSSPDIVLRVNSSTLSSTAPAVGEHTSTDGEAHKQSEDAVSGMLGQLLGIGRGLSGVDVLNGILETRIDGVRRDMQNERLQEKYMEAKAQCERANEDIVKLQKQIGDLEGEREDLLEQVAELQKFDPRTGQGAMGLAMHLGSLAVGNLAKSYATRNPQKFAGLFGPEVLALVSGTQGSTAQPTATQSNPQVQQIASWLSTRGEEDVSKVYRLVTIWDANPSALDDAVRMLEASAPRLVESGTNSSESEE